MWESSDRTTLTSLTESDEFKQLVSDIDMPPLGIEPVQATPLRDYQNIEYALVGMAIDYLLRFEIQKQNPDVDVYDGEWVAEYAVQYDDQFTSDVEGVLMGAKASYRAYLHGSEDLPTQAALNLARLENVVRGGPNLISSVDDYLGSGDDEIESDLEDLLELAEPLMSVEDYVVLNPTLADDGVVADADIISDGALIDMKTTINPKFDAKFWRQLIGYLVLLDIQEENGLQTNGWEITRPDKFGVYFSRSGDLKLLDTSPIYNHDSYEELRVFMEGKLNWK